MMDEKLGCSRFLMMTWMNMSVHFLKPPNARTHPSFVHSSGKLLVECQRLPNSSTPMDVDDRRGLSSLRVGGTCRDRRPILARFQGASCLRWARGSVKIATEARKTEHNIVECTDGSRVRSWKNSSVQFVSDLWAIHSGGRVTWLDCRHLTSQQAWNCDSGRGSCIQLKENIWEKQADESFSKLLHHLSP